MSTAVFSYAKTGAARKRPARIERVAFMLLGLAARGRATVAAMARGKPVQEKQEALLVGINHSFSDMGYLQE